MLPPTRLKLAVAVSVLIAACASSADPAPTTTSVATTETTTQQSREPSRTSLDDAIVAGNESGNRVEAGSIDLLSGSHIDIALSGVPLWVTGVQSARDSIWVVATVDGAIDAWAVTGGRAERYTLSVNALPPGTPPLVVAQEGTVDVVPPPTDASPLTRPTIVGEYLVYITTRGTVMIAGSDTVTELAIDALPDSRLSVSSAGHISVLAGPTNRYRHAALGDDLEASRIVILDPGSATVLAEATIPAPSVVEGIAAPWVDANGDRTEEILVTISNGDVGARLVLFDQEGEQIAQGPPIGRGSRWRNQIGASSTGPAGEIEVIDVRVPHIGGVVEYFQLEGNELVLTAEQPGFTSHGIGSRNLEWALAADVFGDGREEIVLPTQDRSALGILSRNADGVDVVAELTLPGRITSNLAAVQLPDQSIALAVGTDESILRVYTSG